MHTLMKGEETLKKYSFFSAIIFNVDMLLLIMRKINQTFLELKACIFFHGNLSHFNKIILELKYFIELMHPIICAD